MKTLKDNKSVIANSLLVASLLVLCFTFFIDFYRIPSNSMNDTLLKGDVTAILKYISAINDIEKDDILIFHFPEGDSVFSKQPQNNYYGVKRSLGADGILKNKKEYGHIVFKSLSSLSKLMAAI